MAENEGINLEYRQILFGQFWAPTPCDFVFPYGSISPQFLSQHKNSIRKHTPFLGLYLESTWLKKAVGKTHSNSRVKNKREKRTQTG